MTKSLVYRPLEPALALVLKHTKTHSSLHDNIFVLDKPDTGQDKTKHQTSSHDQEATSNQTTSPLTLIDTDRIKNLTFWSHLTSLTSFDRLESRNFMKLPLVFFCILTTNQQNPPSQKASEQKPHRPLFARGPTAPKGLPHGVKPPTVPWWTRGAMLAFWKRLQ